MKQILTEEEIMKERALKNAEMITEEELLENYFTPEEFINLAMLKFNKLADEIERRYDGV